MVRCEFDNIELLDGSLSAVLTICEDRKRYILNMDYDIELEHLRLWNCKDVYYNSFAEEYAPEQIGEIYISYLCEIKAEIEDFLLLNQEPIYSERPLL